MAEREPLYLQALDYDAKQLRRLNSALLGYARFADLAPSTTLSNEAHGVCEGGHLKVTEKSGTPNMSVDVALGAAFIAGTSASDQGCYWGENDAVENVVLAAADGSNPRNDLLVARVRDVDYGGAVNDLLITVVQGTPAASPSDPTVPDDCIVLARVRVGTAVSSIVNANITDLRVASSVWTRPRGQMGYAQIAADQGGITTVTDITGLSVSIAQVAGRIYKTTVECELDQSTNDYGGSLIIADGSNTQLQARHSTAPNSAVANGVTATFRERATSSAPVTRKARAVFTVGGTLTVAASASKPAFILVEDIGGTVI